MSLFDERRLERITETLTARYVDTGALPGVLTLIWRKGALRHQGMAGAMDLERQRPMRDDALFRIYSMSKPITAVALLMLLEEGRIALTDPVDRYIPGFGALGVYAGGDLAQGFAIKPCQGPMRIIDLMRHTSGLTYGILNRTKLDEAYRKLAIAEPASADGLAGMIGQLEKLPLEFEPGTIWNYSVASDVVGYLVESLSGLSFGDFLRRRIFKPLGM